MTRRVLIMLLVSGTIAICDCSPPTTSTGRRYQIEYDHQVNQTCFPWGLDRAKHAFVKAKTDLDIIYDDETLADELVRLSDRFNYVADHRQLIGSNGVYPAYLCGIRQFSEDDGTLIDTIAGRTWPAGANKGWSLVCSWLAFNHGWNYMDKVAIHELGHQRTDLTHLCLDDFNMSPDHSAVNCVMGWGPTAKCTGRDLTLNPEFCDYCCDAIRMVSW